MGTISRVPIAWNGSPVVGGGVSVLHCTVNGEHDLMAAFRVMVASLATAFPVELQWSFPTAGLTIDETSGDVNGDWTDDTPVAPVAGATSQTWANGVGLRVKWTTGAVYAGRHVTGSTFFVPLIVGTYEGAGNLTGATISTFSAAATTFVAAAGLRIYSRPRLGVVGLSFAVNGTNVPDRVSWLRGRRT